MLDRAGKLPWLGLWLAVPALICSCHSPSPVTSLLGLRNSTDPTPKTAAPAIQAGTEMQWSISTSDPRPDLVRGGRARVGPDGNLVLGPYGSCKVAGLTTEQAQVNVEKHLATYVRQAHVVLTPASAQPAAVDVAWRPAGSDAPALSLVGLGSDTISAAVLNETNLQNGKDAPGKEAAPRTSPLPAETGPLLPGMPSALPGDVPVQQPFMGVAPEMPFAGMPGPVPHGPHVPDELSRVVLPSYVIGVTDVLTIESLKGLISQPVRGPHLVRPDGTVGIGVYGAAMVAGRTIDQARESIARVIHARLDPEKVTLKDVMEGLSVDVLAYNSKVYYVITDGAGYGEQVYSFPVTGNETVLDAISKIQGLPWVASKHHIWVARRVPDHAEPKKLPVDWIGLTQCGQTGTNYQLLPGDRVYVQADRLRTLDTWVGKVLSPVERVLGAILLGSQTVNSIRSGSVGGSGR